MFIISKKQREKNTLKDFPIFLQCGEILQI